MTSKARVSILVTALFLSALSFLSARAQTEGRAALIVNDPEVRHGVLDNGLTYYVSANARPSGKAELRLVIKAGSSLEDEDQLGLAHFLEHMLFNGTEKYPKNELIEVLESFGMEFGPDINAYTSFEQTVYRLSVRSDDEEQFLTGLDVLEQWAFNATISEEEFDKERGIIVEEWRRGRGAQARMMDEAYPVLFKDSRWAERMPIGDMDIVRNAPVEAARRFYEDWYRPDLVGIVVTGDINPDEVVDIIAEKFGSYSNPVNARPRPDYPIPTHEETLVSIAHDVEAVGTSVQLYIKYKPGIAVYRSEVADDLAEQLFYVMLNQRLSEISRRENPPYIYGYGFASPYSKGLSLTGLAAAVPEEGVLIGLNALMTEAERVQRHGFTSSELERAKTDVMAFFESYWKQRNDLESADIINSYVDAFLLGDTYPDIDWQWDAVQEFVPAITLSQVNQVASDLLSDSNRVVLVNGPSVPAIENLDNEELLEVLDSLESREIEPWEDEVAEGPLVADPPSSGRITERSIVSGTDIEEWSLSNGARVLIKKTDFRADEVLFRAISEGGASLAEDEDYLSAQFAVDAVSQGGLGEFSAVDLQKILAGNTAEVRSFIQDTYEGLSGSSSTGDVETMLQLAYLHQTAIRRDESAWNSLMGRMADYLKNRDSSPTTLYEDLIWDTIYEGHFRSQPLTAERLDEVDLDTALAFHADRFADASDFTYIVVGDVDTAILEPLVEKWIGGLPGGQAGENWVDRGMKNLEGTAKVSLEAGMEPLSLVTQSWNGSWDGSFAERYRIQSLASALEMKLLKIIREEYSGTYSVRVSPHISSEPVSDYRIMVRYSCDPERVEELTARVNEIVDSWRQAVPEAKFAEDIEAAQRKSLAENLERNSWWMGQIAFAVISEQDPETMLNRYALYDTLTPELLYQSAMEYMGGENYVEAVLYPDPLAAAEVFEDEGAGSDETNQNADSPGGR